LKCQQKGTKKPTKKNEKKLKAKEIREKNLNKN
jgi:hypothetical protein